MKNLKKFISWIGTKKEFKGLNESQIIEALNEMSSSKEGKDEVARLMAEFKQDQKIESASEVLKASGGAALRKARRTAYRNAMSDAREAARQAANAVVLPEEETSNTPVFDRNKARQIMVDNGILNKQERTTWDGETLERYRRGNNWSRLNARKARAAATEGFDEYMYNFSPNAEFDRARYRDRMRTARLTPELDTRRERVAFALKDRDTPLFEIAPRQYQEIQHTPIDTNVDFSEFVEDIHIDPVVPQQKTPQKKAPVVKTTTSNDYWLKRAQQFGFNSIDEVKAWQKQHGLFVDGKFGNNSAAKWYELRRGKVKKDPHSKDGKFSEEAYHPVVNTPAKSSTTTSAGRTEADFRNHANIRKPHMGGNTTLVIDGKEYPVGVTTGLVGNGAPLFGDVQLQNDETYAYNPATGKIRRVSENAFGVAENQFAPGSQWIDLPEVQQTKPRTSSGSSARALQRTVAGGAWK